MSELHIVQYNPNGKKKAKKSDPIPESKWDLYKPTIFRLHRLGYTQGQILALLKSNRFEPS